MSPVVAVCPHHGAQDVGRWIRLATSEPVTLQGNVVNCPKCGELVPIIDGTYVSDAFGRLTPVQAPKWSLDALEAVQGPLLQAKAVVDDERTSEQEARAAMRRAISAIEEHDAKLAGALRKAANGRTRRWYSVFIERLLLVMAGAVTMRDTGELVADAVRQVVEILGG